MIERDPLRFDKIISLVVHTCYGDKNYCNITIITVYYIFYAFSLLSHLFKTNNALFQQTLTRETMIEDDKGKKMEAMKVFSSAIRFLKDQLLIQCENQFTEIEDSDIDWVITVPAIWNDRSKQFMREAAEKVFLTFDFLNNVEFHTLLNNAVIKFM